MTGEESAGALVVASTTTDISPFNSRGYEFYHGMAKQLAQSDFIPQQYQGAKGVGNLLIAMEIASRSQQPLMAVLQSLHVIHGKPGWAAVWVIMQCNQSDRFTGGLRFEWEGDPVVHPQSGIQLAPGDVCYAWTRRRDDGALITGSRISLAMAKQEGWVERKGSKWKTMPEQMLMYRAATFFARTHCPEILFGVPTTEELVDIGELEPERRGGAGRLNERAEALHGETSELQQ